MKWYENWIEVFKTGSHSDSAGNTREWTNEDLDTIIKNYETAEQAPVVLGHPKTDEPAYAWVSELKREGDILFAKLTKVDPEFALWVEKGLYRKISIALSDDLKLRHIGFLGAAAPAVKGLKNDFCEAEFSASVNIAPVKSQISTSLPSSEKSRKLTFPLFSASVNKKENHMFKKPSATEFTAKIDELERELEFAKKVNQDKDFDALLNNLQKESKITAEDKDNLSDVLKALYTGSLGQFSEAGGTAQNLVAFLNNLPKRCEFAELATNKNAPKGTYRTVQEELGHKIAKSLR